jgi:hypothetical protein
MIERQNLRTISSPLSSSGYVRMKKTPGVDGMHRWVGFGVIADNLMNIATFVAARATE